MKFRLVEDIDDDTYPIQEINDYLSKPLSTEEILSILDATPSNTMDTSTPMFILPDGRFVSVKQVVDAYGITNIDIIHNTLVEILVSKLLSELVKQDNSLSEHIRIWGSTYEEDFSQDMLEYLSDKLGWVRINCGTGFIEHRFYCVLGNRAYPSQMDSLLTWLNWGYENDKVAVLIFGDDESTASNTYSFKYYTPDEIIKKIKRFYSSGILYEDIQDKYYRFEVIDEYGENKGGIFRGLNMLIKQLWDEDNYLYDDLNNPISELEYLTPCPKNINDAKTIFAYKEKFYNENKELISDINYVLNELGWKLKTIKMNRPTNIVYEDDVQIGYIK